ncbi:MAG TPA: hypothetical protein VEY07_09275 [Thermoplasmata archaeon]|nr:hypothetical protein [Thermoplasmata archaeon]
MGSGHFRMDLSVVRQGLRLFWEFGLQPLEEMVRVAELLEHSVYERGSLVRRGSRIEFVLLNPPLRMGAFSSIAARLDDVPVAPEAAFISPGGTGASRAFSTITRDDPLTIPVGVRTRISLEAPQVEPGHRRVRLELHSRAIPPRVWFEFSDHLGPDPSP